jgi:hypothetical protein
MKYIMIAKTFPTHHPKKGLPTGFREAILSGLKIHTLRKSAGNRKTGDVISLREWDGRPYASRQVEFARCGIVVDRVTIKRVPAWDTEIVNIAHCDGFDDPQDFANWFRAQPDGLVSFDGVCIYFEDVQPTTL